MGKKLTKDEVEHRATQKKFNAIIRHMARGNFECWVDIPDFRKVKAEITGLTFTNIIWKPISVHFLEKINREITEEKQTTA